MNRDATKRLVSLDLFRGLTIAAMIVVNNLGSGREGTRFAPLVHAEWHGCTLADLVFPFFVFIVGVSVVFSLSKRQAGGSLRPVYQHIFTRTLKIFFLGLVGWFLCGWLFQAICPPEETEKSIWAIFLSPPADSAAYFYSLANLRIPGVLQRLALVYLAVALLVLHSRWRTQAAVAGALLLFYWGLMTLTGFSLEAGADLGSWLDRAIFGHSHLYRQNWDPEGLLSTLPAIATGLLGALTGHWLKSAWDGRQKFLGLLLGGGLSLAVGWLWGLSFPINKNLWTSSYVLYTAGCALLLLAAVTGSSTSSGCRRPGPNRSSGWAPGPCSPIAARRSCSWPCIPLYRRPVGAHQPPDRHPPRPFRGALGYYRRNDLARPALALAPLGAGLPLLLDLAGRPGAPKAALSSSLPPKGHPEKGAHPPGQLLRRRAQRRRRPGRLTTVVFSG